MSKFTFYPSSSNSSRSSSPDLPFPEPLPRSDFLAPDFDPSAYLSSLGYRHQTLDDLRSELRSRSQLLNQELLDLVNSHYEEFLGLGGSVKGGEGKVEEVKMGLMGFQREVEGVREKVVAREKAVQELLVERKRVRKEIAVGRQLLEWEERLERLEGRLMMGNGQEANIPKTLNGDESSDESSAYSEEDYASDEDEDVASLARLRRRVREYRVIQQAAQELSKTQAFVVAQQPRLMRVRNTLLLDVGTAMKQIKEVNATASDPLLKMMKMYRDMDASDEAVKAMKALKMK